jgi:hypothetical protein
MQKYSNSSKPKNRKTTHYKIKYQKSMKDFKAQAKITFNFKCSLKFPNNN